MGIFRVPTCSWQGEGNTDRTDFGDGLDAAESLTLCMLEKFQAREPGDPPSPELLRQRQGRSANRKGTADMNADGKSDEFVIPSTQVNNAGTEPGAESVEERDSAKRNAERADLHRHRGGTNPAHSDCPACGDDSSGTARTEAHVTAASRQ